jgi:hypothetical protein
MDLQEKHHVALNCFAAAMPILLTAVLIFRHDRPTSSFKALIATVAGMVGMGAFFMGAVYLFWSFGDSVIACFVGGCLIAIAIRKLCQWGDFKGKR